LQIDIYPSKRATCASVAAQLQRSCSVAAVSFRLPAGHFPSSRRGRVRINPIIIAVIAIITIITVQYFAIG
jgi:hypothetical protein